jgi:hypothetical protein
MHRSGTSCLAGTLEEAGLHLGRVITEAPHNAKGNRENKLIMDLQEEVLVHSGGAWDVPPQRLLWTDEHRRRRDAIIASYGDGSFGFKDPRTLLTLDFWLEALGSMDYVGSFRHPELVAQSLMARNGGDVERWLDLWCAYNTRLLDLHRMQPFPVVRFDVEPETYRRSLFGVTETLGLPRPAQLRFFEPELRHHNDPREATLPPRAQEIFEQLLAVSV